MHKEGRVVFIFLLVALLSVSLVSAVWWNPSTWSFFSKSGDVRLSPGDVTANITILNIIPRTLSGSFVFNAQIYANSKTNVYLCPFVNASQIYSCSLPTGDTYTITFLAQGFAGLDRIDYLVNSSGIINLAYTFRLEPLTCASFTYSDWGACTNGQQTRTVVISSPSGCTGGSPVVTQACTVGPSGICTDSDSGFDYNVFGFTNSSLNGTLQDSCVSPAQGYLIESFCDAQNRSASTIIDCHSDITKTCIDGACVSCKDSDSGWDYDHKGTIRTAFYDVVYSGIRSFSDLCLDNLSLREYYCDDFIRTFNSVDYLCPYGCSNGACLPAPSALPFYNLIMQVSNATRVLAGAVVNVTNLSDGRVVARGITNATGGFMTTLANGTYHVSVGALNHLPNSMRVALTQHRVASVFLSPVAPLCTSFTYSNWSTCNATQQQTRTVVNSSPSGCTGGSPVVTQTCTVVPPVTATLAYLGRTTDRVGTWSSATPDGRPDFTLELSLNASSAGQITNIRFNHRYAGEFWLMIPSSSYRLWIAPSSITSAAPSTPGPVAYNAGMNKYLITLQHERLPFAGGTATITLQSGQTLTATVSAS